MTDPISRFEDWYRTALTAKCHTPEAMALATTRPDGAPSVRILLHKGVQNGKFFFYTNYESRKAHELETNPRAAMTFHWPELERQIRIEGTVERASRAESEAYFKTRPRDSQLGAWASKQSREMGHPGELQERLAKYSEEFEGKDIPLPPFWGGFRLTPTLMEFWEGKAHRLHTRWLYLRQGPAWSEKQLFP